MGGEPHACMQVMNSYKFGLNLDRSPSTAFQLYQLAAGQQHIPAYLKLHTCYKEGFGTQQSYPNDIEMLDKAIASGDAEALFLIGDAYREGACGMAKDEAKARQYLQRAVDQNHSGAVSALAEMNRPAPVLGSGGK